MKYQFQTASLILLILCTTGLWSEHSEHVLYISSYHPGFSTFFQQVEGIQQTFEGEEIALDVEFMDTKRFPSEENWERFRDYLSFKLQNHSAYDLIITGDDNALLFALEEKDDLFEGIPIIFLGVNNIDRAKEMDFVRGITGVVEKVSMAKTIDLMVEQNPQTETIYAIVDGTPSGQGDLKTFWDEKQNYPQLNFVNLDLSLLSWQELSQKLRKLDDSASVMLLSAYRDSNDEVVDFHVGLETILSSLSIPLYHLWQHGIGDGILGGHVIDHTLQGMAAAEIAMEIFDGKSIDDIRVIVESPNKYIFDYNVMKKFFVPYNKIPKGSRLLNDPNWFYRQYAREIWFISLTYLLLLLAIAFLMYTAYQRKKAESSVQQLKRAVDQLDDTIEIYDIERKLIYANPSFYKIHGFVKSKTLGKTAQEIFFDASEENLEQDEKLWQGVKSGFPWRGQFTNYKPDGTEMILDVTLSPFYGDEGNLMGYISVKKEISDIIDLMEERKKIQESLYQSQKLESVGQMANGIAHDFNNILSGIMSSAQLLLMPNRKLDEKAEKYARMIFESCTNGADIVQKLLNFSQSTRSSARETDMKALIEETLEVLRHSIKKSIDISLEDNLKDPIILCEYHSIQNALLNLGINSAQAIGEKGSITISLSQWQLDEDYCQKSAFEISPGKYCSITVHDNGRGISPHERDKVFEPFYSTRFGKEGTGLGLSSVKRIMEEHRGCIELNSEEGHWTSINLLIPYERHQE